MLNEVHNHRLFTEVGSVFTPCGLIALILSTPESPLGMDLITEEIKQVAPHCLDNITDLGDFLAFCESISLELDHNALVTMRPHGLDTASYFHEWSNLSMLTMIGSKNHNDAYDVQQHSKTNARRFRYYDGDHALIGGHGFDFIPK